MKKLKAILLRIERTICIYSNTDDLFPKEINVDSIPFDILKTIVIPKDDDPLLYDGYVLTLNQIEEINKYLKQKIFPNFSEFSYILECAGIYDWENK